MNVFLVTSVPLVPPWDQGDKNLAYALTTALPEHTFRVLTAPRQPEPSGDNLLLQPLYRSRDPSLRQKLHVYLWFLSRQPMTRIGLRCWSPPDVYHFVYQPFPLSSRFSRLLPEFRRRPTLHTVPAVGSQASLSPALFFTDRVVAISRYGQRKLQSLGLRDVAYIPPGIEISPWRSLFGQADECKRRLGLAGHPVVLFPGHYGPGQGADVMLRALPRLAAQVPRLRLLFACRIRSESDRIRESEVQQAIEAMGLTEMVHLRNTVPDMRPLIGASDVVVLPLETMRDKLDLPTTLLEFLAAGKPILISDLPPMRELVVGPSGERTQEKEVGVLTPPGDATALADAAVALLDDAALRERMGRRGQALVRNHYNIHSVARQYNQLYQELAA